jgi:anti-sigma regulatory factor (Ser/Thr protein kinase)
MPPISGPPALSLDVADGVAVARRAVSALLAAAGWAGLDRGDDLILAMCEIVTNSIRHGRGRRELRVWAHGGTVTCEVTDEGTGVADPLIGYRPPAQDAAGGRGLWIAQQLCDALTVVRRDATTVVRFAVTLPA